MVAPSSITAAAWDDFSFLIDFFLSLEINPFFLAYHVGFEFCQFVCLPSPVLTQACWKLAESMDEVWMKIKLSQNCWALGTLVLIQKISSVPSFAMAESCWCTWSGMGHAKENSAVKRIWCFGTRRLAWILMPCSPVIQTCRHLQG